MKRRWREDEEKMKRRWGDEEKLRSKWRAVEELRWHEIYDFIHVVRRTQHVATPKKVSHVIMTSFDVIKTSCLIPCTPWYMTSWQRTPTKLARRQRAKFVRRHSASWPSHGPCAPWQWSTRTAHAYAGEPLRGRWLSAIFTNRGILHVASADATRGSSDHSSHEPQRLRCIIVVVFICKGLLQIMACHHDQTPPRRSGLCDRWWSAQMFICAASTTVGRSPEIDSHGIKYAIFDTNGTTSWQNSPWANCQET
jgi:hypothetical protein